MTAKIKFQIKAIKHNEVQHLFSLTNDELSKYNAKRILVNEKPGYPCRVSLKEANIGETIITFPYNHHDVDSPYNATGPIFIRDNVQTATPKVNVIPEILQNRFLSVRIYDSQNMMIDATTIQGKDLKSTIQKLFQNKFAHYIHIHNANPGCYNCSVERA
ncbi:MAG: DUF1203 domain-containing protein [Alcanivoracaceae bacterium]|nr:DUF1203 domain-containing protein [Alcanivoracaceae bacterium]